MAVSAVPLPNEEDIGEGGNPSIQKRYIRDYSIRDHTPDRFQEIKKKFPERNRVTYNFKPDTSHKLTD